MLLLSTFHMAKIFLKLVIQSWNLLSQFIYENIFLNKVPRVQIFGQKSSTTRRCRNNTALCCPAARICFYAEFNNELKHGFSMLLIIMTTLINRSIQLLPRGHTFISSDSIGLYCCEFTKISHISLQITEWGFHCCCYRQ